MPVVNRNQPTETVQVPIPTPVQTQPKEQQQTPPAVQQVQRPKPQRVPHLPLSFGDETDEMGNRVQGVSAVILPWSPQPKRLSRIKPKRYAEGEQHLNEEENFHQALDKNPDDHHTRLVFADWLQDRDDPRAEGYRALGVNKLRPVGQRLNPNFPMRWSWYGHDPSYDHLRYPNGLDMDWSKSLGSNHVHSTRREADNAAALAFSNLQPERKQELSTSKQFSRKKMVIKYARPTLTPTQKERAKKVELVVLPKNIDGKRCGTCQYGKRHGEDGLYCTNNQVHMNVKANWGCKLWDAKGVKRLQRKPITTFSQEKVTRG